MVLLKENKEESVIPSLLQRWDLLPATNQGITEVRKGHFSMLWNSSSLLSLWWPFPPISQDPDLQWSGHETSTVFQLKGKCVNSAHSVALSLIVICWDTVNLWMFSSRKEKALSISPLHPPPPPLFICKPALKRLISFLDLTLKAWKTIWKIQWTNLSLGADPLRTYIEEVTCPLLLATVFPALADIPLYGKGGKESFAFNLPDAFLYLPLFCPPSSQVSEIVSAANLKVL